MGIFVTAQSNDRYPLLAAEIHTRLPRPVSP